jgi:hypothetical protein
VAFKTSKVYNKFFGDRDVSSRFMYEFFNLDLLISIFNCDKNSTGELVNYFVPTIVCWSGTYYIHVIFSVIVSVLFVFICLIVQLTYYETKSSTQNQTAKRSSRSDVFMLICKIITVLVFGFLSGEASEWILIITLFVLAAFMLHSYYDERPYYNDKVMKVYLVSTAIFLWSCTALLIAKILQSTSYDGSIPLFFLGLPIVIAIILSNYDEKLTILLTNINKFHKGETVLKQINYFIELVDNKDRCRNSFILLKGYIYLYEESCSFSECALKKYIYSLEHQNETIAFLLQHAETLYQNGISKFPNCTALRISYAFFLLERMNKKQQANLELLNTEKYSPKFAEQFIIYRYKKIIEEQSSEIGDNEENLDVVSNIAYKNHFTQFKNSIAKVATLYMDFWGLLLNPNQDNNEDLAKLNDYGSKINVLVEEINEHFEKMQKLKHNDQEVIRYYSDFLNDILNDKEKASLHRSRLNEIENAKQNYDDVNLMNIDINSLQASDEYQFVIISAQPEKFGLVTNISLGLCSMFGYTRSELIGKNIEFVMPEIFHKNHKIMLMEKINDYKKITMSVQNTVNYKPIFKDIKSFGKNKSRYLVPFNFKVTFIPNNEQNDSVFLAKISTDVYNSGPSQNQQSCYILTNNSFIIQNFTTNAINILGMNSNAMNNGNKEITKFIKEFQEEFLKYNLDIEEKSVDHILNIKRHIIMNKFKEPTQIIWRRVDEMNKTKSAYGDDKSSDSKIVKDNKFLFQKQRSFLGDKLILTISTVGLMGKQDGYVFKFDLINGTKETDDINDKPIVANRERRMSQLRYYQPSAFSGNLNVQSEINKQSQASSKKSVSFNNPNNSYDETMKIDKSFVPQNNWNFHLDPKKFSYLMNPNNLSELKDVIRQEGEKKLKAGQEDLNESGSSNDESSSQSDNRDQSNNVSNLDSEDESGSEKESVVRRIEDYYQVNFSNIKYLVYDMKKETLNEITEWEKESQVEFKKNEDFKKSDKDEGKNAASSQKSDKEAATEEEVVENGKEGILIKQIEYALNKEETQPTITRMKWISFFVFLIYVGMSAIFLALFLNAMSWIIENVSMVYSSYDLIENTIYGVFHVRELVLLNNPQYTNIYQTAADYVQNNTAIILNLFGSSHDLLTSMITTFLTFTDADTYALNNQTIYTTILQDDLSIQFFNLTLSSAFIETNTALYHIAHMSVSNIIPTDKDVFFYLYNCLNDVTNQLFNFGIVYINELGYNSTNFQWMFLYIFIGATVFGIIAYFMVSISYVLVEKRKESYLEVFFEIGGNVIKNSLEKCENFSKKIQTDSLSDVNSNLDENELHQETTVQSTNSSLKKQSSGKKRKSNNSKEARVIKIKLVLSIMVLSLFFFLVYFLYYSYLNTVQIYADIFKNLCLEQTKYFMIFNSLREYFFDSNNMVNSQIVSDLIDNELNNIYSYKLDIDSVRFFNLGIFHQLELFP